MDSDPDQEAANGREHLDAFFSHVNYWMDDAVSVSIEIYKETYKYACPMNMLIYYIMTNLTNTNKPSKIEIAPRLQNETNTKIENKKTICMAFEFVFVRSSVSLLQG